jgi:hypothetical protein
MISHREYITNLDSRAALTSQEAPVSAMTGRMEAALGLSNIRATVLVVVVRSDQ